MRNVCLYWLFGFIFHSMPTAAQNIEGARENVMHSPNEQQSRYIKPVKYTLPAQDEMMRRYPFLALNERKSGTANIECQINPQTGRPIKCYSLSEYPKNYGFGQSSVKVFEKYYLVDISELQSCNNNCWVKITVNWEYPR